MCPILVVSFAFNHMICTLRGLLKLTGITAEVHRDITMELLVSADKLVIVSPVDGKIFRNVVNRKLFLFCFLVLVYFVIFCICRDPHFVKDMLE